MGQYWKAVVAGNDSFSVFDPLLNAGAKLMEHSWVKNEFVNQICNTIHNKIKRVAWVGDYAEEEDFNKISTWAISVKDIWNEKVGITYSAIPKKNVILGKPLYLKRKFLLNFDTEEYLSFDLYKALSTDEHGWCIHPLPLLTAIGNDRGGGDFHAGNVGYKNVGRWATNRLMIADHKPDCFKLVQFVFKKTTDDNVLENETVQELKKTKKNIFDDLIL